MKMQKQKRKLYYPIGLISLVLLPVFCIWYLYNCKAFEKPRVIEINLGSDFENELIPFDVHPKRAFIDFYITDNDKANKIKFDSSRVEIRKIISTNDTTKGVHYIFDNNSKYQTLIRAIDICLREKAMCFVPKENDLWVFNYIPRPIKMDRVPFCGNSMQCISYIESDEEIKENINENRKHIIEMIKQYSISLILFNIMLFLAVKQIIKNGIFKLKVRKSGKKYSLWTNT
jgi:hypothetical protein